MKPVDYAREAIDARLRAASAESAAMTSTTPRVSMAREAIDLRLREASELSRACLRLQHLGRGLQGDRPAP